MHVPLLRGLPDDLALLCLSRVPRKYHHVLRCVSKRWRALLCSDEWQACRSRQNLAETWVYALCTNKHRVNCCYVLDLHASGWSWKLLEQFPSTCRRREGMCLEALGKKLFLFGGCRCQEKATSEVHCYDTSTGKWEEAARMPTGRCYFLSAALDDKIYVIGGLGLSSNALSSWDIYQYHSNTWSSHEDTSLVRDIVKSFVFEGKLYTIHNTWVDRQFARAFDPQSRNWEDKNQQMSFSTRGPTVVIRDTLYMLDETYGTKLMMWQQESEEWVPLGRLAQSVTKPPCQLAAFGSCILIIGHNLSTVVVDTEKVAQVKGMLVGSSFAPKFQDDVWIIDCRTITL